MYCESEKLRKSLCRGAIKSNWFMQRWRNREGRARKKRQGERLTKKYKLKMQEN